MESHNPEKPAATKRNSLGALTRSASLFSIKPARFSLSPEVSKRDSLSESSQAKSTVVNVITEKQEKELQKNLQLVLAYKPLKILESQKNTFSKKEKNKEVVGNSPTKSPLAQSYAQAVELKKAKDKELEERAVDEMTAYTNSKAFHKLKEKGQSIGVALGFIKEIFFKYYLANQALPDYVSQSILEEIFKKFPIQFEDFSINPKVLNRLFLTRNADAVINNILSDSVSPRLKTVVRENAAVYRKHPNLLASFQAMKATFKAMEDKLANSKNEFTKLEAEDDQHNPIAILQKIMDRKIKKPALANQIKSSQSPGKSPMKLKSEDEYISIPKRILWLIDQVAFNLSDVIKGSSEICKPYIEQLDALLESYLSQIEELMSAIQKMPLSPKHPESKKHTFLNRIGSKLRSKHDKEERGVETEDLLTLKIQLESLQSETAKFLGKPAKAEKPTKAEKLTKEEEKPTEEDNQQLLKMPSW